MQNEPSLQKETQTEPQDVEKNHDDLSGPLDSAVPEASPTSALPWYKLINSLRCRSWFELGFCPMHLLRSDNQSGPGLFISHSDARREGGKVFKVLRGTNSEARLSYSFKPAFQCEDIQWLKVFHSENFSERIPREYVTAKREDEFKEQEDGT